MSIAAHQVGGLIRISDTSVRNLYGGKVAAFTDARSGLWAAARGFDQMNSFSGMNSRTRRISGFRRRPTLLSSRLSQRGNAGFSVIEAMLGALILGLMTTALCGCLWCGFGLIQSSRENLRANQIMVQRSEAIRLFNWFEILDTTNYLKPTFTEYYDPQSTNTGITYSGFVTATIPTNIPTAYSNNMRVITISLYWTNSTGRTTTTRSRQWQTQVARYGLQNYVWGHE